MTDIEELREDALAEVLQRYCRRIVSPEEALTMPDPLYLSTRDAAARIGRSVSTLGQWRRRGEGPPCHRPKPGGKWAYPVDQLDAWMRGEVRDGD